MRIREDLVGITTVNKPDGTSIILAAGDEIPEGLVVGDHLIEPAESEPEPESPGPDELSPESEPAEPAPVSKTRQRRTAKQQ